jgi:C-terminal processing protease CtpA/Prc
LRRVINSNLTDRAEALMKGQRIGYIQVSTFDQNVDRQLEGQSLDRIFTDKASG